VRFVDTNILLYAVSSAKADRQAMRTGATAALSHQSAVAFIATLLRFPVAELTVPLLRAALAARARWRLSYWDAAIVEAARIAGCDTICTEDLPHGQDFDGVRVVNPFV